MSYSSAPRKSTTRGSSTRKSGQRSVVAQHGGSVLPANSRMHKINEIMHRDLAKIISQECKDPRLGMVTVTGVEVSKDLSVAKVFVTVLEAEKTEQSLQILNSAAGFCRSRLSQQITLRKMPALRFIYDKSVTTGCRINSIFSHMENNVVPESSTQDENKDPQ